jgi:uncharacterized protein YpmB
MKLKLLGTMLGVLLLLFLINWLYQMIHAPQWKAENQAVQRVYQETEMVDADQIRTFHGENTYWVIFGTNKQGEKMIAWVGEDGVHTELADDGVTENKLRKTFASEHPNAEILRVLPGKMGNEYIWEIFYTKEKEGTKRHYYGFYRFDDGTLIDTYRLGRFME